MRLLYLSGIIVCALQFAEAQRAAALPPKPAANSSAIAVPRPVRLSCKTLRGYIFAANGRPLPGATLVVQGTRKVYVTDSEGMFILTKPLYKGQKLTVGAAGYIARDMTLTGCSLPRLVLEQATGARIKQKGTRTGQVVRLNGKTIKSTKVEKRPNGVAASRQ